MKNTTQQLKRIEFLLKCYECSIVFSYWAGLPTSQYWEVALPVLKRIKLICLTRGLLAAVSEIKGSRLAFTRWLCGRPLTGAVGVPIANSGLPKILSTETRRLLYLHRDPTLVKVILTLLNLSRYVKGGLPINLEAITDPSTASTTIHDGELVVAMKAVGLDLHQDRPTKDGFFEWISTAGPNGPSLASCLQDLPLFNKTFRSQVQVMVPELIPIIDKILRWQQEINLSTLLGLDKYKPKRLRKISIKEDREGKSRIFAIFDYWSQTILTPLHDKLYRVLRSIPQDCTFDQHGGIDKMLSYQSKKWFYSYDLKSATDRFPVDFQERVVGLMFDKEFAKSWREVMTQEAFYLEETGLSYKWQCGQPLGAKSSWAVFTICHHIVVRIAAIRTNSKAHYVLLGDDIVLRGHALAAEYKRIMEGLGVSISEAKSHVSRDTFEFAKIWVSQGLNISGFPIVGLMETTDKPLELAALLTFEAPTKGYPMYWSPRTLSESCLPLTSLHMNKPRLAIYMANKVCWYIAFLKWIHTAHSDWAKYIVQMAGPITDRANSHALVSLITKRKWADQIRKGLADLKDFSWKLARRIPDKLAFVDQEDDDLMIVGSTMPNVLQLADHLLDIPLFAALVNESEKQYDVFLDGDPLLPVSTLELEDLEKLKLPPKPQLKGFVPVRAKASVRALDLLTRNMNRDIRLLMLYDNTQANQMYVKRRTKSNLEKVTLY